MFIEEDEAGVQYLHCDALVIYAIFAQKRLGRMLVEYGSTINILFGNIFDQIEVDHVLHGRLPRPARKDTLVVDSRELPCQLKKLMEFMVVDTRSAYHGVLGRPTLKNL
ncbi:RNase H domain-containing protein [Abeliophyllum distichum]|uniref:RNase H domain-containing protein n=1 Tax=Abeliophyllum distichum TaxID=126358 RepID=A0ABD1UMV0_9LAMI